MNLNELTKEELERRIEEWDEFYTHFLSDLGIQITIMRMPLFEDIP